MAKANVELKVDTKEIDRLAIGGRVYDALDTECLHNKLHLVGNINGIPIMGIKESEVIELFKLVNRSRSMDDINYVVIRD